MPEVLSRRSLNRALLARQHLLERQPGPVLAMVEHLVRLLISRDVVRIALMRGTIHLVSADDALTLRPLVQPVLDRALASNFGKRLPGVDLAAVALAGQALTTE